MNEGTTAAEASVRVDESKLRRLLSQPKLSNREAAEAVGILANRQAALSENDAKLHRILSDFGLRLDRLERAVFDTKDKDGDLTPGLARSLRQTQLTLGTVQRNLTEVHLHNQIMRRLVGWLIEQITLSLCAANLGESGHPMPKLADINSKYEAIQAEIVAEGEKAVEYQKQIEEVATSCRNCQSCSRWRSIAMPGRDAGCTLKLVQVRCSKCSFLFPKPVDPMSIADKCPKCHAALIRQTDTLPVVNYCVNFDPSLDALRHACLERGVPESIIDAVFPKDSTDADATPRPTTAVPDAAAPRRAPAEPS